MELGAGVALDLLEGRLFGQALAERAIGGHRVEAVGEDQEVGGQGQIVAWNSVVAAAVEAEAMEEACREPRRTAYGRPLARLELPGLAQDVGVDGDLAEIV